MIDVDKYLDSLPVGGQAPKEFSRDMKAYLNAVSFKYALARLDTMSLFVEKQFRCLDFTQPGALAVAAELKGRINGIQETITALVEFANEEEEQETNAD